MHLVLYSSLIYSGHTGVASLTKPSAQNEVAFDQPLSEAPHSSIGAILGDEASCGDRIPGRCARNYVEPPKPDQSAA